jgi:hypothetical protein
MSMGDVTKGFVGFFASARWHRQNKRHTHVPSIPRNLRDLRPRKNKIKNEQIGRTEVEGIGRDGNGEWTEWG